MEIYLNLKYPLYWNFICTRNLMIAMWFTCITLSVAIFFIPGFTTTRMFKLCYTYLFPPIELVFLLIAICVYGYVFIKIRWNPLLRTNSTVQQQQRNRMSEFLVAALVVITFILFAVLPDFVQFHAHAVGRKLLEEVDLFHVMYLLAMFVDAVIYLSVSYTHLTLPTKRIV